MPVVPKPGRVVIFPGWLQHQVAPTPRASSEGGRIAISFNFRGRWDVTGSSLSNALEAHQLL